MADTSSMPADVQQYLRITVILNYFLYVIIYFCFITQILFLIFFFFRIIIQRLPTFTSAYFYILFLEYCINSICTVTFHVTTNTSFESNYFASIISEWYLYRFYAFCNTVLVLNRFTGVFCYKQHGQIWSGRSFKVIFALVLVYPFLLSGYTLGNAKYCLSKSNNGKCATFAPSEKLPTPVIVSNLVNASAALVLGVATALARQIKGNRWQKKHKYESYLLVQSLITSSILIIYETLVIIRSSTEWKHPPGAFDLGWNVRAYLIITGLGMMKQIYHVSSIILLFIISKSVRQSFLSFYHLNWLLCKPHRNHVIPATISTSHNQNCKTTHITVHDAHSREIRSAPSSC